MKRPPPSTRPPEKRVNTGRTTNKVRYGSGLGDYPIEDMPPPLSEDVSLAREVWGDEKHVKLKWKKWL